MIAVAVAEEKKEDNVKHVFVQLHFGADAIIGEEAVGKNWRFPTHIPCSRVLLEKSRTLPLLP